jgi:EmrB/QacA subfamily drug resistance transporter
MSDAIPLPHPRRWWILFIMLTAQFMFVVDAFVVNVAIPAIRADLAASPSQIEAIIAVYQLAYAAVLITGGRLGDIHGRKLVFIAGLLGFTATSLLCGLAGSPTTLILARLAQGTTAALMVPQVLASVHTLFPGEERARAFAVFGVALGLGGAAGFALGGWLVSLDLAGLGWRAVFFVNVPVGVLTILAALALLPRSRRDPAARLDLPGAAMLFLGLSLLLGPALFGHDFGWAWYLAPVALAGVVALRLLLVLQRHRASRGLLPLLDLALLGERGFQLGLAATFCFYLSVTSFYLIVTLLLQGRLRFTPVESGLTMVPLALAFVIASRWAVRLAQSHGMAVLIAGCAVELAGLVVTGAVVVALRRPGLPAVAGSLVIYGFGQGLVMAPLFSTVLSRVRHAHAGSASGVLVTVQQAAGATGIAVMGALYFAVRAAVSDVAAFLVASAATGVVIAAAAILLRVLAVSERHADQGQAIGHHCAADHDQPRRHAPQREQEECAQA